MLSRRAAVIGLATGAAVALSGCRVGAADITMAVGEAARAVPGVSSAGFSQALSITFRTELNGSISLATEDRAAGVGIFDEAMRAVITSIHSELPDESGKALLIGGITGGIERRANPLTLLDLLPEQSGTTDVSGVTAGSLYARYGIQ